MKRYRPAQTVWLPTAQTRRLNSERNRIYGESRFECFVDWFFFTHIDPVQRFWHALGMFGGIVFYGLALFSWNLWSLLFVALGVTFFYGFGWLSHFLYDRGSGKSVAGRFHLTTSVVIDINLGTALGTYDSKLERFIQKYPFVVEAYDLRIVESKGIRDRIRQIFKRRESPRCEPPSPNEES